MSTRPAPLDPVKIADSQAPSAAEGNQPTSNSVHPSEASNESTDLATHFPHSMASLHKAFMNEGKVDKDWKEFTKRDVPGTGAKESVLEKNLRLSMTTPVTFAVKDASKALLKFETDDPLGRVIAKGLIAYDPKDTRKDGSARIEYGLVYREVQQLQLKLTEKRDLELNRLYAQCLRCPADELLDRYVPRSSQTPKPSHIKLALRHAVAEKTAEAIREARQEVFGAFLADVELVDMMQRFDKIESKYSDDVKFVSKLLAETPESKVAAVDGPLENLDRIKPDTDAHVKIAEKIDVAREALIRADDDQKKSDKEQKRAKRVKKAALAKQELDAAAADRKKEQEKVEAAAAKQEKEQKELDNATATTAAAFDGKKAVEDLQPAQEQDQKKGPAGGKSPKKSKHGRKGVNGVH